MLMSLNENDVVSGHTKSEKPSRTEETVQKLATLLQQTTSAEELRSSWHGDGASTSSSAEPKLSSLYRALDAGRTISWKDSNDVTRGVPMWIVVRTCKAKWHHDGTWPLLGSDEQIRADDKLNVPKASIHPSCALLRPPNTDHFVAPSESLAPAKREPSADEIAEGYRRRGLAVDEALNTIDAEDDW